MSILTRAPSRIDLAGGTLDIWPLYLLIDKAATVNVAIDLYAEADLERSQGGFGVRDLDRSHEIVSKSLDELMKYPGAEIAGALLAFFGLEEPVFIETRSLSPPQSGLGASSALGIAIAGALNASTGFRYDRVELIEIVKNIEAQVLGVPTGAQDHYPAVFGGASCLWWGIDAVRREPLPLDASIFEERFVLAHTLQPHRSGINNWDVIKRFIDGDQTTKKALEIIGRVAVDMRDALFHRKMDKVETLINEEWEARRQLAPAVSSPEMERILAAAFSSGAVAGKGCGAGGGGCLLIAVRPETRTRIEGAINKAGGSLITFHVAPHGLRVDHGAGSEHR